MPHPNDPKLKATRPTAMVQFYLLKERGDQVDINIAGGNWYGKVEVRPNERGIFDVVITMPFGASLPRGFLTDLVGQAGFERLASSLTPPIEEQESKGGDQMPVPMELTREQAIDITIELWKRIVEVGLVSKSSWEGWKRYGTMKNDCPLCQYMAQFPHGAETKCPDCPYMQAYGSCMRRESPYCAWDNNRFPRPAMAKDCAKDFLLQLYALKYPTVPTSQAVELAREKLVEELSDWIATDNIAELVLTGMEEEDIPIYPLANAQRIWLATLDNLWEEIRSACRHADL